MKHPEYNEFYCPSCGCTMRLRWQEFRGWFLQFIRIADIPRREMTMSDQDKIKAVEFEQSLQPPLMKLAEAYGRVSQKATGDDE